MASGYHVTLQQPSFQMKQPIEALIFAADSPLSVDEMRLSLQKTLGTEINPVDVQTAVDELVEKYEEGEFAFQILQIAGGYQFFTKADYEKVVGEHIKHKLNKRLSTGQLETLSIIAYKQPVSKSEIEQIRGVNCDYVVQKLLEKELIVISGRSEGVGKPILYGISDYFLNYFGLNSVNDMPKLKEVEATVENVIGAATEG